MVIFIDRKFLAEHLSGSTLSMSIMESAWNIIRNPDAVSNEDRYVIIYDQAAQYPKFDALNTAINIVASRGWRCVNICIVEWTAPAIKVCVMYALMERVN